jgi:hypothetical protein
LLLNHTDNALGCTRVVLDSLLCRRVPASIHPNQSLLHHAPQINRRSKVPNECGLGRGLVDGCLLCRCNLAIDKHVQRFLCLLCLRLNLLSTGELGAKYKVKKW